MQRRSGDIVTSNMQSGFRLGYQADISITYKFEHKFHREEMLFAPIRVGLETNRVMGILLRSLPLLTYSPPSRCRTH